MNERNVQVGTAKSRTIIQDFKMGSIYYNMPYLKQ